MWWLQSLFAGAWAFIWHWGTGIALIILLCAGAYFTTAVPVLGPFLGRFRKDLLWAAAAIAVFLGGQYIGAQDANRRCAAKQEIVKERVNSIVDGVKSEKPPADGSAPRDKWDTPEN